MGRGVDQAPFRQLPKFNRMLISEPISCWLLNISQNGPHDALILLRGKRELHAPCVQHAHPMCTVQSFCMLVEADTAFCPIGQWPNGPVLWEGVLGWSGVLLPLTFFPLFLRVVVSFMAT